MNTAPHAQIETDFFCARCGYNLHGLPVTRDERLDLLLVRCSECGGFQPVGSGSTISTLWLQRLATLGLALWVLFSIAVVFAIGFVMVVMTFGHLESFSEYGRVDSKGNVIIYDRYGAGTYLHYPSRTPLTPAELASSNSPGSYTINTRVPASIPAVIREWPEIVLLPIGLVALAGVLGGYLAIIGWHWQRGRAKWALVFPFAVVAFAAMIWRSSYSQKMFVGWSVGMFIITLMLMLLGVWLGLKLGRPTARGLARVFIPAKPRQLLSFLWTADGRTPPAFAPRP